MQKKNAGIARNFALKGLLLLAALTLSTGFFACEVPSVTLTFDAGEGSFKEGKNLILTGKVGENLALPETPVREGYDLAGWNPALPEKYPEKDTEYTAEWEQIPFTTVKVEGGNCTLNGKKVTLSGFWISPYEVTQEEFESLMAGNTNGIEPNPSSFTGNPAAGEEKERRPVEKVSWYDAIVYCNLLSIKEGLTPCYTIKSSTDPAAWGTSPTSTGAKDYDDWKSVTCNFDADGYRLPTEAEWEYAARGGQTGISDGSWDNTYSGSGTIDDVAWYTDNSAGKTHEVGKKQSNALGLYDMSGNVFEYCWDRYGSSSGYPGGTEDPEGPDTGSDRVKRGGSWSDLASYCAVSGRINGSPYGRYGNNGFRLVRSAQ